MSDLDDAKAAREAWLKSLKPGDTVGVEYDNTWHGVTWEKLKVKKVTPTGIVVLDNDTRYKGGERRVGTGGFSRMYYKLVQWTENIDRTIQHNEMVQKVLFYLDRGAISREKVSAMTDGELLSLLNLLRKLKADK